MLSRNRQKLNLKIKYSVLFPHQDVDFNVIIIAYIIKLEEVCARPLVCEGVEAFVVVHALRQRESDVAVVELLHLRPAAR